MFRIVDPRLILCLYLLGLLFQKFEKSSVELVGLRHVNDMIRSLNQHFLGAGNVSVNVVDHKYLRRDISIPDYEECWDANLG